MRGAVDRRAFEAMHGYYVCGVAGCVLEEHHCGPCCIPEISRTRSSREATAGEAKSPVLTETDACVMMTKTEQSSDGARDSEMASGDGASNVAAAALTSSKDETSSPNLQAQHAKRSAD